VYRNARDTERQQDQPNQRIQYQRQQSQRPAEKEKNAPQQEFDHQSTTPSPLTHNTQATPCRFRSQSDETYPIAAHLTQKAAAREELVANHGMVHIATRHSVEDALGKLQTLLKTKGIPVFALIDHSGEAAKVGMEMHPTKLLIFGNPKGGTPLMLAAPTIAIDLPLKILIWEDDQGKIWVTYNTPEYLAERHQLPANLAQNIGFIATLAATVAE
jgi:uncharacterized protein (DUF302 family)